MKLINRWQSLGKASFSIDVIHNVTLDYFNRPAYQRIPWYRERNSNYHRETALVLDDRKCRIYLNKNKKNMSFEQYIHIFVHTLSENAIKKNKCCFFLTEPVWLCVYVCLFMCVCVRVCALMSVQIISIYVNKHISQILICLMSSSLRRNIVHGYFYAYILIKRSYFEY